MLAFGLGFYIMQIIYKKEGLSMEKLDSLFVYTILGTMIGARLGHVVFYQIELFEQDFLVFSCPLDLILHLNLQVSWIGKSWSHNWYNYSYVLI